MGAGKKIVEGTCKGSFGAENFRLPLFLGFTPLLFSSFPRFLVAVVVGTSSNIVFDFSYVYVAMHIAGLGDGAHLSIVAPSWLPARKVRAPRDLFVLKPLICLTRCTFLQERWTKRWRRN